MKQQTKLYTIGTISLGFGLFCNTFLPILMKNLGYPLFEKYIYAEIEFLFLAIASVLYLFSPKYYKTQMLTVLLCALCYVLFVEFYPVLNIN